MDFSNITKIDLGRVLILCSIVARADVGRHLWRGIEDEYGVISDRGGAVRPGRHRAVQADAEAEAERQGGGGGRHGVGVGSCAVGATMAAGDGTAPTGAGDGAPAVKGAAPAEAGLAVGTPIRVRDAEVTITGVETRDRVGIEYAYENASEGGTLVVVRYSVRNVGERPLSFFQPRIRLIDPAGTEYSSDTGKTVALSMEGGTDAKAWSDLNPGITTNDAEVFEVALDRYDPATWQVAVDGKRNRVAIQ